MLGTQSRSSGDEAAAFLSGGGQMGALMRAHDWSASPLGSPETWPQSLRSVVGLLLGSKFAMFVAWGPELGFLYNDPYAEILGAKHPKALGARFEDIWGEIWPDISPLIDEALAGKASYHEDLPLLMNRKGFDEETWFTFSYSPVRDEGGQVAGMFCACQETTDRVLAERSQIAETERQRRMFEQAPGFICTLRGPDHVFDFVNDSHKRLFGDRNTVGKTMRQAFPDLAGQGFYELLDQVYATGQRYVAHAAPARFKSDDGSEQELFLDFIYEPMTDPAGQVIGIFCEGHDVTEAHRAQQALAESEARYRTLFTAIESGFCIIEVLFDETGRGQDYRFLEINDAFERQTGLPAALGRRVREMVPEHEQYWFDAYGEVARSGDPARFMAGSATLGRWWDVHAFRVGEAGQNRVAVLFNDVTEVHRAHEALRESEEDYRYAADLNPQVAWTARPDGQLDRVAPRWKEWTGTSGLGASYAEGLHPDDVQRTFEVWGRSVETGEPYDIVHRVRRLSGEHRWIRSRAFPRRDEKGRILRWYGATEDIHEQKTAEDHLNLMVLELNHRVKNNLSTVQSIAMQSLRSADNPLTARDAFLHRIAALAAAHDILTREQWEGAGVGEVAHGVLDALTGEHARVRISGPALRLDPKTALSLSMAFHELGTNALKYGALSRPDGYVALEWREDSAGDLAIRWIEHGGPPVTPPERRGFGSRLLERGLAAELHGEVLLRFEPEGLECLIRAPLAVPDEGA